MPREDKSTVKEQFTPLIEYLEQELGISCQLIVPDSYQDLLSAFQNNELDLAWFGGYTFVEANRLHGAHPLVSRDVDIRYTSYFLVSAGDAATQLGDYRAKRLAFASRLSTSGHLMPRHFLESSGVDAESFFAEIRFTGAHDKTVFAVRDREADIGAASAPIVDSLFASGRLSEKDVRVLQETPPYVDHVWACQTDVPKAVHDKLRDAFLKLSKNNPAHAEILKRLRADYFLPVHESDFNDLRTIIDGLDFTEEAG